MKLLIFNPKPDESEEVLCNHLWIGKPYLKRAKRLTRSLLIHKDGVKYKAYNPLLLNIEDDWRIRGDAYSYNPLTVVTYED